MKHLFRHLDIWFSRTLYHRCENVEGHLNTTDKQSQQKTECTEKFNHDVNWSEDVNTSKSLLRFVQTFRWFFTTGHECNIRHKEFKWAGCDPLVILLWILLLILSVWHYVTSTTCLSSSISGASSFSRLMMRPEDTQDQSATCLRKRTQRVNIFGDLLTFNGTSTLNISQCGCHWNIHAANKLKLITAELFTITLDGLLLWQSKHVSSTAAKC